MSATEKKDELAEKLAELKVMVDSLDVDYNKMLNGNSSAGIRTRNNLRVIRDYTKELVKDTISYRKLLNEEKAK